MDVNSVLMQLWDYLIKNWQWWLLPILGYIVISVFKALAKKGVEKLGYTNEEGKLEIQWKNITIITLLILVLILLFKSGMIQL